MDSRLKLAAFATALVGVGTAVVYYVGRDGRASGEPSAAVAQAVAVHEQSDVTAPPGGESRSHGYRGTAHPFSNVPTSRVGLPLESDPFAAQSVAEQQWLDRNGFPNEQQWVAYNNASDEALKAAAAMGDALAQVFLDHRRLLRGEKEAIGELLRAAESGSTFALSLLSSALAGLPTGDPRFGYALSRVQEMKGDFRVAAARDAMFPRPLAPEERLRAEEDALKIFAAMKARSPNGRFVDPRPYGAANSARK